MISNLTHFPRNPLQINDILEILPFEGRKSSRTLKRTEYSFVSSSGKKAPWVDTQILFSSKDVFNLKLKIEEENFFLKGDDGEFFLLNGSWVKECLVCDGDRVQLGYNFLTFRKKRVSDVQEKVANEILLSQLGIVLIGETGTGKTSLAKDIHLKSKVSGQFVHLNLSSFSENLIESEIFGHKKGAFTGAVNDYEGALSQAENGTLFFDEIDSLSFNLQVKLLLFLDDYTYKRVGCNRSRKVKAHIIFSSGSSLEDLLHSQRMRKDFYYRLVSLFVIKLPALRNEPKEVVGFINDFCVKNKIRITNELLNYYKLFNWPGNYRQLKEHLKKKAIVCKTGCLDFCSLDKSLSFAKDKPEVENFLPLEQLTKEYFHHCYISCNGIKASVKKRLEITEYTFNKLVDGFKSLNDLNI